MKITTLNVSGRTLLAAAVWSSLAGSAMLRAAEHVQKGDVVAVTGDSITEQKEYSANIEAYLMACQQDGPLRTAQFGRGGDSMGFLWSRGGPGPVLAIKPSVVTTCYGMNDGGYKPAEPATLTAYRDGMVRLVREYKKNGVRMVVVGSPGAVDTERMPPWPRASRPASCRYSMPSRSSW